jgi:hypothetical protein
MLGGLGSILNVNDLHLHVKFFTHTFYVVYTLGFTFTHAQYECIYIFKYNYTHVNSFGM